MGVSQIAWVLDHERETTGAARLVLLALADRCDANNECWPSKADIARRANVSEARVSKWIRELEGLGLVERVVQGAADSRIPADKRPNLYRLNCPQAGVTNGTPAPRTGGTNGRDGGYQRSRAGGTVRTPKPSMNHKEPREPVSRMDYTKIKPITDERMAELGVLFD